MRIVKTVDLKLGGPTAKMDIPVNVSYSGFLFDNKRFATAQALADYMKCQIIVDGKRYKPFKPTKRRR